MNLWSVSILIEDKFKDIYCEWFEDFHGYLSSSLFFEGNESLKKNNISSKFLSKKNLSLGEFHQNQFWILEAMFNEKPSKHEIKIKLNFLAKELNKQEYNIEEDGFKGTIKPNTIKFEKVIHKDWIIENRKLFPVINIDNFYIFGSHILKLNHRQDRDHSLLYATLYR